MYYKLRSYRNGILIDCLIFLPGEEIEMYNYRDQMEIEGKQVIIILEKPVYNTIKKI